MKPDRVKEFLNKYLLEHGPGEAMARGYKDMAVTMINDLNLNLTPEQRNLVESLCEAKARFSKLPKDPEKSCEYRKPESLKVINFLFNRVKVVLEYALANYDTLPSNKFKNTWKKDHLSTNLRLVDERLTIHGFEIMGGGSVILRQEDIKAISELLHWGFEITLGTESMELFTQEFNSAIDIFNEHLHI